MPTIRDTTGASIHGGKVEQRAGVALTVTGTPAGTTTVSLRAGSIKLGTGLAGTPIVCDLSALALGSRQITASWPGGSDTKTTTVVPDPQPGPSNTGHHTPEAELQLWTGPATLAPGEYHGLLFTTAVAVGAGVVLRDSLVRPTAPGQGGRAVMASGGALLEDVTIDGSRTSISIGIGYASWTGRRLDISGCNDGARISSHAVLLDSWVHHLKRLGDQHPDCVQTTGGTGGLVQHCTLSAYNDVTGDLCNSAVQIGGETAPLVDFAVRDCWVDGGNYTVNVGHGQLVGPVVLEDLRYGPHSRYGELVQAHTAPVTASGMRADGTAVAARYH